MSSVVDRIAPPRMGSGFRWLLGSSYVSNIGDGIALAAGPLLVASQTSNAVLVAMAALLQRLPWLLLGLYVGALADRVDRRRMVMVANSARAVVVAVLATSIITGHVSIAIVLAAMLLLGIAEVFADVPTQTLLPMLVNPADLGIGNARLQGSFLIANHIAGPPIGAFLFAAGMAWPFVAQAVLVLLAVLLVARIALPPVPAQSGEPTHVLRDIAEGVRWLVRHDAVRTLAIVIIAFNITWGAAWSVLVLYSLDHLGMGPVGFGLLTSAAAVGGLISTSAYGRIEARFDLATVMRVCLLLEVLLHLALALTTTGWVAMLLMVVFGAYAFVWGTVSTAVRQRATPMELQGRVGSVYSVCVFGGIVIGQAIGGPIAEHWGLTAPFWFAFVGAGITLALVWRQLAHIAHAPAAEDTPRSD
jgi:predicted MFS family arabinose efflux permease